MKRGEIWEAVLEPRSGSEQRGRRPVIIFMRDNFVRVETWSSIMVVPLSSSPKQRARGPTAVELGADSSGLSVTSAALCHQVTTLDRAKFSRKIGELSSEDLRRVEFGVLFAQGYDPAQIGHE